MSMHNARHSDWLIALIFELLYTSTCRSRGVRGMLLYMLL
jgi:hypothetical protein